MNRSYQVKLDTFEGPLDLLLHLIHQYEIDIYDIPVARITEQYMDYIHTMQYLELNVASEYLVMASTLLVLKSQMLLPKQEIDESDEDYMEDPREELMQRLIEYRKYKEAAKRLETRELGSNQTFSRPPLHVDDPEKKAKAVKSDISVYEMINALGKMFERKRWTEPLETKIKSSEISIEQRMTEVLEKLKYSNDGGITFDELFEYPYRSHVVVTFMALLELMKNNEVICEQENHFGQLHVFYPACNWQ
ncbi:condensin subunit ScpA [Lentibacillus persicus]|uniref:Segregation and condensation protein A n=1 Tax=Lentibacillus persicus TaxID=640948 RepID=A0A1I1SY41_9BACI|nr:segregation/condensation protein A [Lentibacillus persicus]SFD51364.1 condensin subunit ScpA [Lentibacillus persicus]